jgi:hypothetical protein
VSGVRCERTITHEAHDVDGGRCPGYDAGDHLPPAAVAQHAAEARAAIGGAR